MLNDTILYMTYHIATEGQPEIIRLICVWHSIASPNLHLSAVTTPINYSFSLTVLWTLKNYRTLHKIKLMSPNKNCFADMLLLLLFYHKSKDDHLNTHIKLKQLFCTIFYSRMKWEEHNFAQYSICIEVLSMFETSELKTVTLTEGWMGKIRLFIFWYSYIDTHSKKPISIQWKMSWTAQGTSTIINRHHQELTEAMNSNMFTFQSGFTFSSHLLR